MKNFLFAFVLFVSVGLTSSDIYSQVLTFEDTKQLLDKTMQNETIFNEDVILFIVTKDTNYYSKAKKLLFQLRDNYLNLMNNGDHKITYKYNSIYYLGESNVGINIKTNFNWDFFKTDIVNGNEKANKSVTFKEKTYTISKKAKVEFDEYYAEWERSVRDYKKFQEIKW
jgi:hypothetical protein